MYSKIIENGYILIIGKGLNGEPITKTEYDELLSIIHSRPIPNTGFEYKLRADTLEWELVELPEPTEDDKDASESDYIDALNTLGVNTNEEN